jgi:LCP family protein required for cell wall assembly
MASPSTDPAITTPGAQDESGSATDERRQDWEPWDGDAPKTPFRPETPMGHRPLRRRRWLWITLLSIVVLVLIAGGGLIGGRLYLSSVEGDVARSDTFAEIAESERPVKPAEAASATNILILGSDSRDPDSTGGSRTDTIMIAHVTADKSSAQVVSIPRDTWVTIPRDGKGHGGGKAKINAAYAWGGAALMVRTVEQFTKVRIDHVLVIDFSGFTQIVDALGGIDVDVEKGFTSIHPPYRYFSAGEQHLNGAEALDYSRQRKQFAHGDFSRIEHQQQVIKAIMAKATSKGILGDPVRLNKFLKATAGSVTADKKFNLIDTAMQLRGMSSKKIRLLTNPSAGTGMEGTQSVVYPNIAASASLFAAVNSDTAAAWKTP